MPQKLKLATAQVRTLQTLAETLNALEATTQRAASQSVDIILFPEAYLGGYPRSGTFGAAVGARDPEGRELFLKHFHDAVDLGDTPAGAGLDWVEKKLEVAKGKKYRGDGTREELERIARESGVFIVTGVVERCAGTLYCGVLYVCPKLGVLGKRRKVMPTGSERLIWGQGSASTLRAVTTEIKGVRLCIAAAICWENYMPLLRQSLYSQNVNLWFAPTADARDTWEALMRTVGCEGRCFVVSANQCVRKKHIAEWNSSVKNEDHDTVQSNTFEIGARRTSSVKARSSGRRRSTFTRTEDGHEICLPCIETQSETTEDSVVVVNGGASVIESSSHPAFEESVSPRQKSSPLAHSTTYTQDTAIDEDAFACRGGSMIVSPLGQVLAGPIWEEEDGLLVIEADFEDCERGRLDLDVAGSYSRMDSFKLTVEGLDLAPPPF